ncbi:hypothetical protein [Parafrankia sp. EUN1f]|uniref:hypothetical protein n=1 Tax=Parafrankia sp. EUN1f TaxID=102897 RepID=UPI0012F94C98|nr:hypothetical protein [Parafrankia sp. EUN1f]
MSNEKGEIVLNARNIAARVAIGACGPVALTMAGGAFNPASAASAVTVPCSSPAVGTLRVDAANVQHITELQEGVFTSGTANCYISNSNHNDLTVAVQIYKNGSWSNVATGHLAGYGTMLEFASVACPANASYRGAAIVTTGGSVVTGTVTEPEWITC